MFHRTSQSFRRSQPHNPGDAQYFLESVEGKETVQKKVSALVRYLPSTSGKNHPEYAWGGEGRWARVEKEGGNGVEFHIRTLSTGWDILQLGEHFPRIYKALGLIPSIIELMCSGRVYTYNLWIWDVEFKVIFSSKVSLKPIQSTWHCLNKSNPTTPKQNQPITEQRAMD